MTERMLRDRFWELDKCLVAFVYDIGKRRPERHYWETVEVLMQIRTIFFLPKKIIDEN